ncbi:VWA domain-containing protein [Robertkochia aurantiaca]|uniref:VWA domain-containing protein n=1 Tax=Robertkochia aurantiaca TaxID=2873700 RepID=UPI001CCCBA6F|nr:VWA domain-containing protein [Robertkochia sp. 3YJGBD-33]
MKETTLLLVILAALISIAVAYAYYRDKKNQGSFRWLFTGLRALSIFCLLLLLINPLISNTSYISEKPELAILADNTISIRALDAGVTELSILEEFNNHPELSEKFDLKRYRFSESLETLDTLDFSGNQTDIGSVLKQWGELSQNERGVVMLLTDGNQTFGKDYQFFKDNFRIYPVVLGDTTAYSDLRIEQVNVNRYSYLGNDFPVEIFVGYSGDRTINKTLSVYSGTKRLFSKSLNFSPDKRGERVEVILPAFEKGIIKYRALVEEVDGEANTDNNSRRFAVEVIDTRNKIALISAISHPDLGALRQVLESNERREVVFLSPGETFEVADFSLFIVYQPDNRFDKVLDVIQNSRSNFWVFGGKTTDWNFLNNKLSGFDFSFGYQSEEVQAIRNPDFNELQLEGLDFTDYAPVEKPIGDLILPPGSQTLLYQYIAGVQTFQPLLFYKEEQQLKQAFFVGEGIWKWRVNHYAEHGNFQRFDNFFLQLTRYLSSDSNRSRLTVDFEPFYYGGSNITLKASYYDKSYTFDPNATLRLELNNRETGRKLSYPFLIRGNTYEVGISDLSPGEYDFRVNVEGESLAENGSFTVIDYQVERQFVSPDIERLRRLAENTGGSLIFPEQADSLLTALQTNDTYRPVQKSRTELSPLIDFRLLLLLMVLSLAAEWFLRKYRGLI